MGETKRKIKVLIVDDSRIFREVMMRGLSSDPEIEVVATAGDAFEARDKIIEYRPDVMTCDVEMPKMNGIEFIKKLIPQYPLPVIVVSTVSGVVFDAMNAGAVDFVGKPDVSSVNGVRRFIEEMTAKVKIASVARVESKSPIASLAKLNYDQLQETNRLIAIGASTGGTEAIFHVLKMLPENTPGIVIVQHIPPNFSRMFADRLNETTRLKVKEAVTGDYVEQGRVLVAPGDQHMMIKKAGNRYRVECFNEAKVNGHCPSVDVLFESVAKAAANNAIGVILTGMGSDGAKGLLSMRKNGARTIGQDEKSSVVYGMPKAAFTIGAVEKQVSLDGIAPAIFSLLKK